MEFIEYHHIRVRKIAPQYRLSSFRDIPVQVASLVLSQKGLSQGGLAYLPRPGDKDHFPSKIFPNNI
jgi:hypothetical protein